MPFTPSHVVAVLPFTARRLRRFFDPTALVIGAMIPDLPLFVPRVFSYSSSHDLLWGPLAYDLVIGLVAYVVWVALLRRPLTDLAPRAARCRLPQPTRLRASRWPQVVASLVLGAGTHVVWDTFTHEGRLGTDLIPALDAMLGPLPGYKWLQYGGGVLGLAGLVVYLAWWWRRAPARPDQGLAPTRLRRATWVAVGAVAMATAATATILAAGLRLELIAYRVVTWTGAATASAVGLCCLFWWAATGRRTQEERPRA